MRKALYLGALVICLFILVSLNDFGSQDMSNTVDFGLQQAAHASQIERAPKETVGKKIWACPMHAHIMQDHPGTCPICGMDLVESTSTHGHSALSVEIDAALQQRMGVRLASLTSQVLSRDLQTYGNVAIDESSIVNVSPKIEGWIRSLHVSSIGQRLNEGQLLYEIYSPELVQRQREYIELLQRRDQLLASMTELTGQNAQVAASLARERIRSREKFRYADVENNILDEIEDKRRTIDVISVRAPRSGFVTQIGARNGSYVTPMVNLISIADVSSVWVDIVLYPDQVAWVREGDEVSLRVPNDHFPELKGHLRFANPVADPATRTVKARVVIKKPPQWLRPGTFVDVRISTQTHEVLALPRSAVMRTGRGNKVILARENGHFIPIHVDTGIETEDYIEITGGLEEGAQVAVNGQFLLDAAASLSDAAQRMQSDR